VSSQLISGISPASAVLKQPQKDQPTNSLMGHDCMTHHKKGMHDGTSDE